MSIEKFIMHLNVQAVTLTEQEVIDMLPVALAPLKSIKWDSEACTDLLILRYGLAGNEPHTLKKLADIHSLSPERIREVIAKSFRFIRKFLDK